VGCDEFVVRFHNAVAWTEWIEEVFPGAEFTTEDGFTYFTLPEIPAFGPRISVAARDERTLVFANDLKRLRQLAVNGGEDNAASGATSWSSLDGGLATLIAKADLKESVLTMESAPRMAVTILLKAKQFGAAFDVDPATSQSQMRFVLTSLDLAAAKQVQAAVEGLLPHVTAQLRAQLDNPSEAPAETAGPFKRVQTAGNANTERNVRDYWMSILESCTTRLEPQADGTVQVRIDAEAVLPQNIHTEYEYEIAEGAPEDEPARR
jgi:hypothetical protein